MSAEPTKSFKDFIGWAFVGLAGIVLALVSMIYSTLSADVGTLQGASQNQAILIQRNADRADAIKEDLQDIKRTLRSLENKMDQLKK